MASAVLSTNNLLSRIPITANLSMRCRSLTAGTSVNIEILPQFDNNQQLAIFSRFNLAPRRNIPGWSNLGLAEDFNLCSIGTLTGANF